MTPPDASRLFKAMDATWAPAEIIPAGPWTLRKGLGGGQRVSTATVNSPVTETDIAAAEAGMRGLGQRPLFMIRPEDSSLDTWLENREYEVVDPVSIYLRQTSEFTEVLPPARALPTWPAFAVQVEMWEAGGIDAGRVAVMDFGLARIHDPDSISDLDATASSSAWNLGASRLLSTVLTVDGVVMGTPAYMAPEQHTGDEPDARVDQFALCAALYEVLMGRRPFSGRTLEELARQKFSGRLDFRAGRLRLPRALRAVLRRGLHPEPTRRHASMRELRDALTRLRRHPPNGRRRPTSPSSMGKKSKNSVRSASVASEIILPFAAGGVLL